MLKKREIGIITVSTLLVSILMVSLVFLMTNSRNTGTTGKTATPPVSNTPSMSFSPTTSTNQQTPETVVTPVRSGGGGGGGSGGGHSSSSKSSSASSNVATSFVVDNTPVPNDTSQIQINQSDNTSLVNETLLLTTNSSSDNQSSGVQSRSLAASSVGAKSLVDFCNSNSKETNEGPTGQYCKGPGNYENCLDYFTKSTVYAYDYTGASYTSGTDYCSSDTLNEAFLQCSFFTYPNSIGWQQKNCNDYDGVGDWIYYCTADQVRRHRGSHNFGCVNGACTFISGGWIDDQLVSSKGDTGYCDSRKNNGCSLCTQSDYDCDWNTDCSGNLVCKGSASVTYCPLAECGCCNSNQRWDSTLHSCCECSPGDGPCCDGCHYRSSNTVCNSHISGTDLYKCTDNCLDSAIYGSYQSQYCSGASSSCSGGVSTNTYNYRSCLSPNFCSGSTSWGTTIPTCTTALCTSGDCCDTSCGVYNFKSSSVQCLTGMEYGCFWGNDLGSDVSQRTTGQYCSGNSNSCNGRLTNGGWSVFDDCSNTQWCGGTQGPNPFYCSDIACGQNSDCGTDYWYGVKCDSNNVYGTLVSYRCKYPGTKQAICDSSSIYQEKENCGTSGYTGDNYCYDNDVYRDYITRGCSNAKCTSSTSRILQKDCGTIGCTNGKCNDETCTDECSSGQMRCNGNYTQTCGNYDADSCLEWPSSTSGNGNQFCTYGCSNAACKSAPPAPLPDLTVTDLAVQNTQGKNVTLAFTIRNIGNATANYVYWMVDSNSSDTSPRRTAYISLDSGNWTRAYMTLSYAKSGIYNPKAIVDFSNIVKESNENNNQASITITV